MQFRDEYTIDQIASSPVVHEPLTKLQVSCLAVLSVVITGHDCCYPQCCPTSDGAAAAIVCSEAFVLAHGLQGQAVEIIGMAMATDPESTLTGGSCIKIVGGDMTKAAVAKALAQSKADIGKVKVVELHDCFSANEVRLALVLSVFFLFLPVDCCVHSVGDV